MLATGIGTSIPRRSLNLIEEINHRVLNEYTEAIASLSVAAARSRHSATRSEIANVADRLREHAELHRVLSPPREGSEVNIAEYLGQICLKFSTAMLAQRGIFLVLDTADHLMAGETCWRIGLVVAELIRNAARHGLRDSGGEIFVQVTHEGGELRCLVRDTGRPPLNPAAGRGQSVIAGLVQELGGSAEWSFGPEGCAVLTRFPSMALLRSGPQQDLETIAGAL
ncbi:hypothetical protein GCM10023264_08700 [Sphingomonas daechungensis]|uniref:histidine kinase n=1 Tax=Sphingomonas daechungensis TaxID=1176646 RepID=A0ABX6SZZ5_9SPHN|nr:ATP-binding protein [Sphingomonas daechungensis]QNP43159.1 sensor histidine kinase [Sphingomonas daechungensis]